MPPSSPFCSSQAHSGLDNAHLHWGGQSALLSPPAQMLVSPENTLKDTRQNNV